MNEHFDDFDPDSERPNVEAWVNMLVDFHRDWQSFRAIEAAVENCEPQFLKRCQDAAEVALTMTKYSTYVANTSFLPVSFSAYVSRLEKATSTSAAPVLRHFRIEDRERLDFNSVPGFARLWRALGLSFREAIATLRITLFFPDHITWSGARLRSKARRGSASLLEAEMRELDAQLTPSQRARSRHLEELTAGVYATTSRE